MQKEKLLLADLPLKQLLLLFDADATIVILALGDVMHPASGYVGAEIVSGVNRVGQLLEHPYNFEGIVCFEAIIQNASISYKTDKYEIKSDAKTLAKIENEIREKNYLSNKPLFVLLAAY